MAIRVAVLLIATFLMLRMAWMGDDALITLRSALNWTHGLGAGFNAYELVQGYTHPLWFLLWTGLGLLTGSWVIGILVLSVALSAVAIAIAIWPLSIARTVLVVGVLVLSNAFMDYTTSGLETPLAYVLVALLVAQLQAGDHSPRSALVIGLLMAGLILTRADLILLVLPLAVVLLWRNRRSSRALLTGIAACLAPLLVWFTWSFSVYGSFFPNTLPAKTNASIPRFELVAHGVMYIWVSIAHDPITFIALVVSLSFIAYLGTTTQRALAGGVLIYLGYVVWIGGDFMAGRFLAVPFFAALIVAARVPLAPSRMAGSVSSGTHERRLSLVGVTLLGLLGVSTVVAGGPDSLVNPKKERWDLFSPTAALVADERGFYVARGQGLEDLAGAIVTDQGQANALHAIMIRSGQWLNASQVGAVPDTVSVGCNNIIATIVNGPSEYRVVTCALTDAFLAQQTVYPSRPFAWRPGHLERMLPEGYLEAIEAADPSLVRDPRLRADLSTLWDRIRIR